MLKALRAVAVSQYLIFLSLVAAVYLNTNPQAHAQEHAQAQEQADPAFQQWL